VEVINLGELMGKVGINVQNVMEERKFGSMTHLNHLVSPNLNENNDRSRRRVTSRIKDRKNHY
jgi:hypothetical protein